jgi:hypothetical protein
VHKITVAELQRRQDAVFRALFSGLFAYNEVPTFAVANDCWFRARQYSTRPFFLPVLFNSIT